MIATTPKVEFTLSFDNYLDIYGRTPINGRPEFLRWLLVLALLLIFVGFLLAHQDSQSDSVPPYGSLAVTVGVCSFVFCLPLWFFIFKPNPNKSLETSRKNYEHYFAEPRAIEFGDSGWKYSNGESTNSGSWTALHWTALHSTARLGGTVVIADTFVQYFIPAAAFFEDQHSLFSGYCEKALSPEPRLFDVQLSLRFLTYLKAKIANSWIRNPIRMASLYTLGLLFSIIVAYIFAEALTAKPWPIAGIIALALLLAEITSDLERFKTYRRNYGFDSVEISSAAVCFRDVRPRLETASPSHS